MSGLRIERKFSNPDVHPLDEVKTSLRTAVIKDDEGKVIFTQDNVIAPVAFSDLAVNVVASKYFFGKPGTPQREGSVIGLVNRVSTTIADWGLEDGYFDGQESADAFEAELSYLLINQYAAFNSPVWFNVGLHHSYGIQGSTGNWRWDSEKGEAVPCEDTYKYPQSSACFIQSVDDTMQGIMELAKSEAMLFKYGSGTGTDLSPLRSTKEFLNGGGKPSGPVSFMRVYDSIAGVIKSGGKCLAPDQPVYTASGPKTAKDLADSGCDFTVLSFSKRLGRVAAKTARAWKSGIKELVSVRTDKGEFRVSSDHPFMLKTGEIIRAAELKAGLSLMAVSTNEHSDGYVRVGLVDGKGGRELLHRLVASDVMNGGREVGVVHHGENGILDSEPGNLTILVDQAEHAAIHSRESVAAGAHVFQLARFSHAGEKNGMHSGSRFWRSDSAVSYRETQSKVLKNSGRATGMQELSRRTKMLNLGYELINAGHDISTFDNYIEARKRIGRRVGVGPVKQMRKFTDNFGSYQGFLGELAKHNHRVVSVSSLGLSEVYSIEVDDEEIDDKRPWSEHNYVIAPMGTTSPFMSGVVVLNTRRAAKMQTLKVHHPDILEFIECKVKEDNKARALIAQGYDSSFNGEAYGSVMFQNANLSVRATDDFLSAAESGRKYPLIAVTTGDVVEEIYARHVLDKIAEGTWVCGDPGMQYHDTIQRWHTTADTSTIESSNPCSEFLYINDSACNLSSLNLMKFRNPDGSFEVDRFCYACSILILAQEIIVDRASYPTKKIAENSHDHRPLGLGYANLGALLMSYGLPYDSDLGRSLAGAITGIMHGQANLMGYEIARVKGPFEAYEANRDSFARVMLLHANAGRSGRDDFRNRPTFKIPSSGVEAVISELWEGATLRLDAVAAIAKDCDSPGFRNSQVTLLAPTGTIAFMMDCDTTGIEPDIALVKYKTLAGGGVLKIVNRTVPMALWNLGYKEDEIKWIIDWIDKTDTIEGCPDLKSEHLRVFDCAFRAATGTRSIPWEGHIKMMAAVQPFLSGAISKTVNVPSTATVDDIREAYLLAWKLGLKAVAIYRDGSKASQPLNTKKDADKPEAIIGDDPSLTIWDAVVKEIAAWNKDELEMLTDHLTSLGLIPKGVHQVTLSPAEPKRRRLPDTRASINHKFSVGECEGYISVGCFPDGTPGELFVTMAKEGSTIGGMMDSWATAISLCLQYGVPLDVLVSKFSSVRYEPFGFTKNPAIGMASSIVDYIVRWLGQTFIDRKERPAVLKDGDEVYNPNDPIMHMSISQALAEAWVGPVKQDIPGTLRDFAKQRHENTIGMTVMNPPSFHAPACPQCGNLMIPAGRCHACPNCGTSNGCS